MPVGPSTLLAGADQSGVTLDWTGRTANLRTKTLDFRGLDSSRILIVRGGILMSLGSFPETMSQQILVGVILVGRLGVVSERAQVRSGHGRFLISTLK